MGVAIENSVCLTASGVLQQSGKGELYIVAMTMGHIKVYPQNAVHQNFRLAGRTPVTVTVSRNLIQPYPGELFPKRCAIIKVISQVNHRIRRKLLHTGEHKPEGGMGV